MDKLTMSVSDVAQLLTETAMEFGLDVFPQVAAQVLEDNSPREIDAIGQLMPPLLRELLPKRVLH
jgi:hypothetical protein